METSPLLSSSGNRAYSDTSSSSAQSHLSNNENGEDLKSLRTKGYSPLVAYAFTVNMIIGAGILGLPNAFYNGGVILSIILLCIATCLCLITMTYLVEACARAEAFIETYTSSDSSSSNKFSSTSADSFAINDSSSLLPVAPASNRLTTSGSFSSTASNDDYTTIQDKFIIGTSGRKFEVNELCGIFLAIKVKPDSWWNRFADDKNNIYFAKRFYEVALFLYNCGAMWLYSSIFASSLSVVIPLTFLSNYDAAIGSGTANSTDIGTVCQNVTSSSALSYCVDAYYLFLVLFALIMIPVACMDLTAQRKLQISLTGFAFTCMIIMIITVLVALDKTPYAADLPNVSSSAPFLDTSRLFEKDGFGKIFTTAIVSQVAHPGAPGFVVLVREKQKTRRIFGAALFSTFLFYALLSTLCCMYFSDRVQSVVTLNWKTYSGESLDGSTPVWASIISYLIVMFPTITVSAAFPLYTISLAESLVNSVPVSLSSKISPKVLKYGFRIILTVFPIGGAALVRDVSKVLEFEGLCGFILAFFAPCLLHYFSKKISVNRVNKL